MNNLICVEYPGRVENPEKMLETVGGIEELSKVFSTDKKRIQLKFHPDNIYSKPCYGDQSNNTGLLLKVQVRKSKKHPDREPEIIGNSVVGSVSGSYKFDSMCDYQYLPIARNEKTNRTECIYNEIVPNGYLKSSWLREKPEAPYFLPPTFFSRTDTVQKNMLKNDTAETSASGENYVKVQRSARTKAGTVVNFNMTDPVPNNPTKFAAGLMKVKLVQQEQYDMVYQLFQKRPVWTKGALLTAIHNSVSKLAYIISSVAYFYVTGPWRMCYVRFGYDPRKHYESRIYQTLEYRVRRSDGFKSDVTIKRNYAVRRNLKAFAKNDQDGEDDKNELLLMLEDPIFDLNTIPSFRVKFYQIVDIHVPKIQEMLDKIPTLLSGAVCNEKRGWLPPGFVDQCRTILCEIASMNMKHEMLKKSGGVVEDADEEEFYDEMWSKNEETQADDEGQENDFEMEEILPDDPEDEMEDSD